jgi:hypothetical protein
MQNQKTVTEDFGTTHCSVVSGRYVAPPPPQSVIGYGFNKDIPRLPGVYFIWSATRLNCLYVGQSVDLRARCATPKKSGIRKGGGTVRKGDRVSWLVMGIEDLLFAEAFYIGLLRPPRNNGIMDEVICDRHARANAAFGSSAMVEDRFCQAILGVNERQIEEIARKKGESPSVKNGIKFWSLCRLI